MTHQMKLFEERGATDRKHSGGADRLSEDLLRWLMRSFESHEYWRKTARDLFLAGNGDSVLARTRLAAMLRRRFLDDEEPLEEDVLRWADGFQCKTREVVSRPKVTESIAAYVDWAYIADYLLLSCASPLDEIVEERQRREYEYQQLWNSYKLRWLVYCARKLMREHPDVSDDEVLELLRRNTPQFAKGASLANVKEAKRSDKSAVRLEKPVEPKKPAELPLYKPMYF